MASPIIIGFEECVVNVLSFFQNLDLARRDTVTLGKVIVYKVNQRWSVYFIVNDSNSHYHRTFPYI